MKIKNKFFLHSPSFFALSLVAVSCASALPAVQAAEPFSYDSAWMLGDWNGTRSQLKDEGVDFQINYTMESASNLAGGYHSSTTMRYADQWAFGVDLDLEKLLGWNDTEFQMTITDRNGRNLSDDAVSRNGTLSSVQEVYGRGQTWRLTQFWLRKHLFDNLVDIKAGRVTVGEDFDTIDSKFQNLAFGGGQAGNWRGDHWYNWPVSQWGGRVAINVTPDVFFQVGFYNQTPYNYDRGDGFRFEVSQTEGNLVPAEVVWHPTFGPDNLKGNYRLGGYYSSVRDQVYGSWRNGNTDTAHAYGGYVLAQQQLFAQPGGSDRGLTLTAQAVMNDHKTAKIDNYQSLTLVWKGLADARPEDEIGIGASRIHVNSSYSTMQRRENRSNGAYSDSNPAWIPIQHGSEYDYEVYYNVHATNWLQVRPNLQYVVAPGAESGVKNALVGGISANLSF